MTTYKNRHTEYTHTETHIHTHSYTRTVNTDTYRPTYYIHTHKTCEHTLTYKNYEI